MLVRWIAGLVALLALAGTAQAAQELVLSRDDGQADSFESLNTDFHYIKLELPKDWKDGYAEEVQFYGQRFGDISGRKGTVVIWGPVEQPKMASRARELGEVRILATTQFDLSAVPEQPGWFSVKLDPVHLPVAFGISLFTFSDDKNGVKVGLTARSAKPSYSSATHPGAEGKWTDIKPRRDGRNWLLRLKVRDSVAPATQFDSSSLSGADFTALDDGGAEGFATLRKKGMILRCDTSGPRKLESVFVYAKLDGNWFGSKRTVAVLVLDKDLKVLSRTLQPYTAFTNVAGWAEIKFAPVNVGAVHYISIEPGSSATEQFMLGYDASGPNKASSYGTTGAPLPWPFETPAEATTNWMIRAKYAK
jgi:hypothetical protein